MEAQIAAANEGNGPDTGLPPIREMIQEAASELKTNLHNSEVVQQDILQRLDRMAEHWDDVARADVQRLRQSVENLQRQRDEDRRLLVSMSTQIQELAFFRGQVQEHELLLAAHGKAIENMGGIVQASIQRARRGVQTLRWIGLVLVGIFAGLHWVQFAGTQTVMSYIRTAGIF